MNGIMISRWLPLAPSFKKRELPFIIFILLVVKSFSKHPGLLHIAVLWVIFGLRTCAKYMT